MADVKHTPGPWRYVRANPSPTTGEHLIAGAKPGYLAEVRDCGSGSVAATPAESPPRPTYWSRSGLLCRRGTVIRSKRLKANPGLQFCSELNKPAQPSPKLPALHALRKAAADRARNPAYIRQAAVNKALEQS